MIFLLLLLSNVYGNNTAVSCDEQLFNFYVSLGMSPLQPVQPVINFTTGVLLGVPFVTLGLNAQRAALTYANSFSFVPLPNNSYFSIDLPYCYTDIQYTCVDRIIYGITHLSNCTLLDRDTSFGSSIAGRLFVYPDQTSPCLGTASVTIFNVILGASNTSNATYDIGGIRFGVLKSESEAIFDYRNQPCDYSNGTSEDVPSTDSQFKCLYFDLVCPARPVNDVIIAPVNLTYGYRCLGEIPGIGNAGSVVRTISQNLTTDDIESEFDLSFVSTITGDPLFTSYPRQLILANTIRQFDVQTVFDNYLINGTYGGYNATLTNISLFPVPNQFLPVLPCVCNLTIFCDSSMNADFSSDGTPFIKNNSIPVALSNTSTPIVIQGAAALFNDAGSFDPNNQTLTYYWVQGSGPDNVNITIQNPTDIVNVTAITFQYVVGVYQIIEIVSNGQDLNISISNTTAVSPVPLCAISGGSQIFGNVNETIYLNASLSLDALNSTLVGFWIQLTGFPVEIENNDTLVANFTPYVSGTYVFQVNLTNGMANCTFQLLVQVTAPTFSPINDPNTTLPPFVIPDNRTVPPIDINQTNIPLATDAPLTFSPANSSVTPVPTGPTPIFPPFPPDNIAWHSILFWVLFSIFIGLAIGLMVWVIMTQSDDGLRDVVPNKYITLNYS